MKTVSLSIDIDPLVCYYAIHGLRESPRVDHDPVIISALPRFLTTLSGFSVRATFFVTASAFCSETLPVLKKITEGGHEIANHSYAHNYAFSRMGDAQIEADIRRNHALLAEQFGFESTGFRSPGYNSSVGVVRSLKQMGYAYDSSLFPSFVYNAAKWLIMQKKKLDGTPSCSMINAFSDSFASGQPAFIEKYITDRYTSGDLLELPITTLLPPLGIPLIGTAITMFPELMLNLMLALSSRMDFVNIEMHALDLCELQDSSAFKPLEKKQRDLAVSVACKHRRLCTVIDYYRSKGFAFKTLGEVALLKRAALKL